MRITDLRVIEMLYDCSAGSDIDFFNMADKTIKDYMAKGYKKVSNIVMRMIDDKKETAGFRQHITMALYAEEMTEKISGV